MTVDLIIYETAIGKTPARHDHYAFAVLMQAMRIYSCTS